MGFDALSFAKRLRRRSRPERKPEPEPQAGPAYAPAALDLFMLRTGRGN